MTVDKFGNHVSQKYSRYRNNYFPFNRHLTEKHIDANRLRIINVARPVASTDAVNKLFAEALALYYTDLKNWPGNYINGSGKRLANFARPIDGYDVVTKEFLDGYCVRLNGDKYDCRGKRISNAKDPVDPSDLVTLSYLERKLKHRPFPKVIE